MKNRVSYSIARSVRGISHSRKNAPNEDSVLLSDIGSRATVAAVADGHGSEKCFRAHLGSRFAVKVFEKVCETAPNFASDVEARQFASGIPIVVCPTMESNG